MKTSTLLELSSAFGLPARLRLPNLLKDHTPMRHGCSVLSIALFSFSLRHDGVVSVVIGAKVMQQVRDIYKTPVGGQWEAAKHLNDKWERV